MAPQDNKDVLFRYMPVANPTVGKVLLIKGRGEGIVRGILTREYAYLMNDGDQANIKDVFRVCLQFYDNEIGACLDTKHPAEDFLLVPGWVLTCLVALKKSCGNLFDKAPTCSSEI